MPEALSISDLPGGEAATRFEGKDHGAQISFFLSHFEPGRGPGLHRHPYEETFIVQAGTASFTVDGETLEAGAEQVIVVPAGAAHRFVNSGDDVLRQISIHPSDAFVTDWLEE
jgi:quercetin dioxygenase-like cupin family protein